MASPNLREQLRAAKKIQRPLTIVKYGFTLFGSAFLALALFLAVRTGIFLSKAVKTEGVVVELYPNRPNRSDRSVLVAEFSDASGRNFAIDSPVARADPGHVVGDRVAIYYAPSSPREAKVGELSPLWGDALFPACVGAVFFLVGGSFFWVESHRKRREAFLRAHGIPIDADFLRVELNTQLKVNGRNPFQILAQGRNPFTSEPQVFKSRNIFFDPTPFIAAKKMRVFVDPNDARKYCVDIDFLAPE